MRRFENLTGAEERHAQAITSVITALGGKPVQQQKMTVTAPETVAQADAHCREIELEVIDMYGKLIADCADPQVKQVLERIQAANYRHLRSVGG